MEDLRLLVNRCLQGEQNAMLALVERFQGPVFGLCFRMLGNREDAEDAVQETFVRVLRNLAKWDHNRDFEPWLFAIAGNRCRTALASRRRRPTNQTFIEPLADHRPDPTPAKHLAEELQLGLEQLRADYRQAFVLFHQHELSYEQIAETMSKPLGTIKTWIHRARTELIRFLQQREAIEDSRYEVRRV
ncbi:MAG: RNA polymerase sigma factor [Planctomycetaceae bacterium]|nr:RNA polymerase sigma factor [Planctomycetales bacterium]MCB9924096.1 RNA polymerase sigma factor [Planctomycetaceae bacterium]